MAVFKKRANVIFTQKGLEFARNENSSAKINLSNNNKFGIDSRESLSEEEYKNYTNFVLCLQSLPAMTSQDKVPGARTRFDDFLATHINKIMSIHGTEEEEGSMIGVTNRQKTDRNPHV
ncbi:hypothetical protein BY996DRAFT_6510783 [Phakopsora pachyrhizi]|nr:hypothetical protein BY996DRAFT_6510783 [Phakopsora pachyrhizi]